MGKIKLDKDQKAYLETTAGSDITLTGFTKATKAHLGAVELENIWSHAAIPYLANHTSLNKQQAARRLLQHKIKQRLAEFKTAVMMRNHTSNMMVHVTQELEIVAAHHVKEYRTFMHDGDGQKHPQESTDDETEGEADRPSSKRSKQEAATSKLSGPLLSSEDETSDFRTTSLQSSTQSSLNSIEFTHFNRLVGRGTTSCQLSTDARIVVDGADVSQILMEMRRGLLRRQNEIREVDELLTLNFIFQPSLLKRHLTPRAYRDLSLTTLGHTPLHDITTLADTAAFAAQNTYQATRAFIDDKKYNSQGLAGRLLSIYTSRPALWQTQDSFPSAVRVLGLNEDSYTESAVKGIIYTVMGDLEVVDHWSRDPFPTPHLFDEEYYPDYFAELDGFPIMVAEVKKPGVVPQEARKDDQRRVPSLLKLAIDRMLEAGVVEPSAVGILVQDSRCTVSVLTLEKEAIYLHRPLGVFQIPTSNIQLGLLLAALGPLASAKAAVKKTFEAVESRSGWDTTKAWRRPSYHLKGVKIPAPVIPEDDKEE
ncbi:hypothetical protein EC957_011298 [Mortierella hygrophila]|uniref:Uncharacterized protein n=1 Tax=Mortierella hygrophila TaxID=979708 RepID=A0A9P6K3U4_9FUNG|nr:hypothetical protein EC957_011298 [Mortierella hygrophila]